jgi:hypothetical protein
VLTLLALAPPMLIIAPAPPPTVSFIQCRNEYEVTAVYCLEPHDAIHSLPECEWLSVTELPRQQCTDALRRADPQS